MENEPIKQEEIKNMSFEQIDEYLKKYYALDNQMRLMYEETSKYEIPEDKEEVEIAKSYLEYDFKLKEEDIDKALNDLSFSSIKDYIEKYKENNEIKKKVNSDKNLMNTRLKR